MDRQVVEIQVKIDEYLIIFFIILSLLSTAAVLRFVSKLWKRLMRTFVSNFIVVLAYNYASLLVLILGDITAGPIYIVGEVFLVIFAVSYLIGFFYITIMWHFVRVVSVLEASDIHGLNAMTELDQGLMKDEIGISVGLCYCGIHHMYKILVFCWDGKVVGDKIGDGIISLVSLSISPMFGLIVQTIIHFVCKSYLYKNNSSADQRVDRHKSKDVEAE